MLARHHLFRIALLLLVALAGVLPSVQRPNAAAAPDTVSSDAFGAQLFLLSPTQEKVAALTDLPGSVHAVLYAGEPVRYIASGSAHLPEDAAEAGIAAELLDADTSGKVYYFVDAQTDSAAHEVARFGSIIYADAEQLVLAVPSRNEASLIEALPTIGIRVALIPANPLPIGEQTSAPSAAVLPATVEDPLQKAEPVIESMLSQVTAPSLARAIAELSGEQPADIDGSSVTLATRYTFASTIRNAEKYLSQRYISLGIPVSQVSWSYSSYTGRNVVAELRGTIHPERIWLVGGHFDDTSESPYSLAPGADDNASGSAATLALAGILSQERYQDTIRFVHFSGEEQGHWGSIAYARSLYAAGAQVMGFINLDMIGWDGDGDHTLEVHSGTRANSIDLAARFTAANQTYRQGLRLELKQSSASRFSDHASFWDYGYASYMAIENFFDDTILRDRNPWYHSTGDRLSRVNLDYVVQTTRTTLAMLAEAAGLQTGPVPTATTTFTATPRPACPDLVANGGFEATTGWTFAATANPGGYSTAQAFSGARSARLGIAPAGSSSLEAENQQPASSNLFPASNNLLGELAPLGASYSTVYQSITIPADASAAILSFRLRPGADATSSNADFQRVLLLKPGSYNLLATVTKLLANATAWQQVSYDLTPYRGQSVVLYFEVYNDNTAAAPRAWMYVDDVSAFSCTPPATPTATNTTQPPTPTGTPEPITATPTATDTPAPTSTGGVTPPLPTTTPTWAPTATNTPVPTTTSTVTTTPTPLPAEACTEHVANGGFESDSGWIFARTANPGGYTTATAHSSLRAGRLGVVTSAGAAQYGDNQQSQGVHRLDPAIMVATNLLGEIAAASASYSTAYQTVYLPTNADAITLTFWYWPGTGATTGNGDFQRVLLLRPGTYAVVKTLTKMLANTGEWRAAQFDLSAYRGQSLVLYFEVFNDDISAGPRTWLYVDDVRIEACSRMGASGDRWLTHPVYLPLLGN